MKIAITGHTSGIGKGILEYYSGEHEVIGFSLENGYNINDYSRILEETKDCDIFINNAYSHYTQSEIVSEWAKVHSNDKHLIISTSSIAAEPLLEIENMFPHLKPYGDEKYAINKASWNVNHSPTLCKSSVIMPGVVETSFYNPYDTEEQNGVELYNRVMETNSIITVDDLVKTIDFIIQSWNGRNFIASMTVLNAY
jgi:nucleoside-diphosphate-sugar epimerase